MSAAITVRDDFEADELRCMARSVKDANQARRLLAIAAVYEGMDREEAARIGGMDRQTLRDWVHRFNEHGPAGLTKSGLPVGYQAIAASGRDKTATAFSRLVEKEIAGFVPPPGFD